MNLRLDKAVGSKTSTTKKEEPTRKIFILKGEFLDDTNDVEIQRLLHPGTENKALFVLVKSRKLIFEILQFEEPNRSWLINNSISSDGRCFLTIPIDILFFVLYYLKKNCSYQAIPLKQWKDEQCPLTVQTIINFATMEEIKKIADVKTSCDFVAYKYNKSKALAWISLKVRFLARILRENSVYSGTNAVSGNYDKSKVGISEQEYIEFSCGIIGNYLDCELNKELLDYFCVMKGNTACKRRSVESFITEPVLKKGKLETLNEKSSKTRSGSTKEKSLVKAALGTKSISSFFKR